MFFSSHRRVSSSSSPPSASAKPRPADPKNAKIIEINLISAQDLFKTNKQNSQIYVMAYIDANQKLISRTDTTGGANPTWNDKFVFLVDQDLVSARPNSCMVFEIRSKRKRLFLKRSDKKIGEVRVLLANLLNQSVASPTSEGNQRGSAGCGFLAFRVRDSSGEPRGILNLGAVSLDILFRGAVPSFFASALDHRKLGGGS